MLSEIPLDQDEIEAAKQNLNYFTERVLGYENNTHQDEWYDVLENLIDGGKKKFQLLAPRNHSKTSCVSINFPSWVIGNNPNARILLLSSTASQSESFLRAITNTIENDERYIEVFGRLKPDIATKWTQNEIIIKRNTKEKDPTIATAGAGGAILSKRADIIIADDILSKENTRTPEQRKKILEWWRDVVLPILDPNHGKLLWVGTVWNSLDLAHEIKKDPTYDFKRTYKAIIRHADRSDLWAEYKAILYGDEVDGKRLANEFYAPRKKEMDAGAIVLWPQRWSYKTLMDEMYSVGSRSFALSYQNDVEDDENSIIKGAWIDACSDPTLSLMGSYEAYRDVLSIIVRGQGVDLAGFKLTSDWNVIATVGITKLNKFVLMNLEYGHWTPAKTRSMIINQGTLFDPEVILVESNAYQVSMVKDSQDMSVLPIRGFQTTGEKYDDTIGVNGMAVGFENGQWILPSNPKDKHTNDVYERLYHGLCTFVPGTHTSDFVMALWMAWTGVRKHLGASKSGSVEVSGSMYPSVRSD